MYVRSPLATASPAEVTTSPVPRISGCTLIGTAGNDGIAGTPGADTMCGLAGNDRLAGAAGSDVLQGGAGADTIMRATVVATS